VWEPKVSVTRWLAAPLLAVAVAGSPTLDAEANPRADAVPMRASLFLNDDLEGDCEPPNGDAVPAALSVSGSGPTVRLRVLYALDGITIPEARRIVDRAARIYAPMHVELTATYAPFRLPSDGVAADGQPTVGVVAALRAVQARYERPPAGHHVVHLLTAKDLVDDRAPQRDGKDTVAGIATCVGGARYDGQQFSVGEAKFRFFEPGAPDDFHAIVVAHEIGHLLGAQHHYGNCHEGRTRIPGFTGSCTTMSPFGLANSEVFGTLERRVIRAYAEDVASRGASS